MLLRTRILSLFALAILLVAASVALPAFLVLRNREAQIIDLGRRRAVAAPCGPRAPREPSRPSGTRR